MSVILLRRKQSKDSGGLRAAINAALGMNKRRFTCKSLIKCLDDGRLESTYAATVDKVLIR